MFKIYKMYRTVIVILLHLCDIYCMDETIQELLTPLRQMGETCGYASCPLLQKDMLNVHIVPHTHGELGRVQVFDTYYTGHDIDGKFDPVQQNMKRILDYTITELWTKPNRKFTFSDMPYLFHWWARRDETVRRMVYQLIRQGRLYLVGGGWSMSDESTTSYQAIIDHYTYSLRKINATFLDCGRPLVAWQTDNAGHSREFASLFAQMGFDGLFVAPISFDDEVARLRGRGMEMLWRGSDDLGADSDIFTHKLFDGYFAPPGFCFDTLCNDPLLVSSSDTFYNLVERVQAFIKSVQHRQAPHYATRNVLVVMGERMAYYDASLWFANIDKLIAAVNQESLAKGKGIYAFYSTPACYLKAVYDDNPTLRTKQDDFFPHATDKSTYAAGAYAARPGLKFLAREGHRYLQITKQFHVTAKLGDYTTFFEDFHWINGVFQDHHIITGEMTPSVKNYYVRKMSILIQKSTLLLQDGFNKIRDSATTTRYYRCKFNVSSCINTSGPHAFIVIYNPLAWPVTMPVRLPIQDRDYVVFTPKGERIPAAMLYIPDHVYAIPTRNSTCTTELIFIAENIPAMGFRSYYFQRHDLGWERPKRELIKKINQNKPKKYLVRQTNPANSDDEALLDNEPDYQFFEDLTTTPKYETKIVFGNVSGNGEKGKFMDVMTPRSKLDYGTRTTESGKAKVALTTETNVVEMTEAVTNVVAETTEAVTNVVAETTETVTNVVAETTEAVTNVISETTEAVTNVISETTEAVTNVVAETTEAVTNVVAETTEAVTNVVAETTEVVTNVVLETTEAATNVVLETSTIGNVTEVPETTTGRTSTVTPTLTTPRVATVTGAVKDKEDLEDLKEQEHWWGYKTSDSPTLYIRNRYVRVNLDKSRRIANISIANGIKFKFDIQFIYYVSDDPVKLGQNRAPPGAYVFRSIDNKEERILDTIDTKVYKNKLGQEIHCQLSKYASFVLRLYRHSSVLEVDWVVGPIPIDDGLGKDVFVKYVTNLKNQGVFYTDANGRQTIKRIRNRRPTYEHINKDPVAGNIYPVTSKIFIEDINKDVRFSVFNDRSQGGSSLKDGEINLMLHRRLFTDDIGEDMNEMEHGNGVIARGTHYLYISRATHKPTKVFEKKLAKEIELRPQVLVSSIYGYGRKTKQIWIKENNEFSALKTKLPVGIHVLSLERWDSRTILLRLENFLEKSDAVLSGVKKVILNDMFVNLKFLDVKETTLAGNMLLKDWTPLEWQKEKFAKNFNEAYGTNVSDAADDKLHELDDVHLDREVFLSPQQIRTFVLTYEYVQEEVVTLV